MDDAKINAAVKYLTQEAVRAENPIGKLTFLLRQLDEARWSNKEIHRIRTSCWQILGAAYGVQPPSSDAQPKNSCREPLADLLHRFPTRLYRSPVC